MRGWAPLEGTPGRRATVATAGVSRVRYDDDDRETRDR
jgi:hypothetical protein